MILISKKRWIKPIVLATCAMMIGMAILNQVNVQNQGGSSSSDEQFERGGMIERSSELVTLEWNTTSGGMSSEEGSSIWCDSEGNSYTCGEGLDVIKWSSNGTILWIYRWTAIGGSIWGDGAGNLYICGYFYKTPAPEANVDLFIVKLDTNGTQLWNQTWGGAEYDAGFAVTGDDAGNVYVCGSTRSFGVGWYDLVLIKWNTSGTQLWNRTFGGPNLESGRGIWYDSNGYVYICANTQSFGNGTSSHDDFLVTKWDKNGGLIWNYTWGGTEIDRATGIWGDDMGGIYISGFTFSYTRGVNSDAVLMKLDASGKQIWCRVWVDVRDGNYDPENLQSIWGDGYGYLYCAGSTSDHSVVNYDTLLMKWDINGNLMGNWTFGGSEDEYAAVITGYLTGNSTRNLYITGGNTGPSDDIGITLQKWVDTTPFPTTLTLANDLPVYVYWRSNDSVDIVYQESLIGVGISNAFVNSTNGPLIDNGNGIYSLPLKSDRCHDVGVFFINVTAQKDGYQPANLTMTIIVTYKPVALFILNTTTIFVDHDIKFNFTGESGAGQAQYRWNFGDGTAIATIKDPVHRFSRPGKYNVTLVVQDEKGYFSVYLKPITVVSQNNNGVLLITITLSCIVAAVSVASYSYKRRIKVPSKSRTSKLFKKGQNDRYFELYNGNLAMGEDLLPQDNVLETTSKPSLVDTPDGISEDGNDEGELHFVLTDDEGEDDQRATFEGKKVSVFSPELLEEIRVLDLSEENREELLRSLKDIDPDERMAFVKRQMTEFDDDF